MISYLERVLKLDEQDAKAVQTVYDYACVEGGNSPKYLDKVYVSRLILDKANKAIEEQGLSLKKIINYLTRKNLLDCEVHCVGFREPSSETILHSLIYLRRCLDQEVNAIIHCHAPNIVQNPHAALSITSSNHNEIGYGSLDLAVEAVVALGDCNCVLLRDHGPVAVTSAWPGWLPIDEQRQFGDVFEDVFAVLQKEDELATAENYKF